MSNRGCASCRQCIVVKYFKDHSMLDPDNLEEHTDDTEERRSLYSRQHIRSLLY